MQNIPCCFVIIAKKYMAQKHATDYVGVLVMFLIVSKMTARLNRYNYYGFQNFFKML